MANNLINELPEQFKKAIKDFGITEVFFFNGDMYTTSKYDLDHSLIEAIENHFKTLIINQP